MALVGALLLVLAGLALAASPSSPPPSPASGRGGVASLDWSKDPFVELRRLVGDRWLPDEREPWVLELLKTKPAERELHCEPEVVAALREIWSRTRMGQADWEAGFRVDRVDGKLAVVYAPHSNEFHRLKIPILRGITVAIAHTHPNSSGAQPSEQDLKSPVPNYVVSRWSLYVTDPKTRRHRFLRRDWGSPCR